MENSISDRRFNQAKPHFQVGAESGIRTQVNRVKAYDACPNYTNPALFFVARSRGEFQSNLT